MLLYIQHNDTHHNSTQYPVQLCCVAFCVMLCWMLFCQVSLGRFLSLSHFLPEICLLLLNKCFLLKCPSYWISWQNERLNHRSEINRSLVLSSIYGKGGTGNLTLLLAKWVGCQCCFCLRWIVCVSFSGRFVERKLMLSSNFKCYQLHDCKRYDFGHTLLCYISPT
jgi:hypothetical protein